jgi:hypothetical protein
VRLRQGRSLRLRQVRARRRVERPGASHDPAPVEPTRRQGAALVAHWRCETIAAC